ncbi:MAG: addiction module protein [Desulfobulbaceae bacterium]|nr:addiction module protein [Desulfobulbaceae bacterium]
MSTELKECEQKARQLPLSERATLIRRLIDSLDNFDEGECERLWLAEAVQRYHAYQAGNISSRPADEVFRGIHDKLKEIR